MHGRFAGRPDCGDQPLPENLDFLLKNIVLNDLGERIELFPLGVGATHGLVNMYGGSTGASFVAGWSGESSTAEFRLRLST